MTGLVDAFAEVELVVVGDLLLDGWLSGPARALSREAPVPVVSVRGLVEAPGGAGNAAVAAAALGAGTRLVSVVGDDADGDRLRGLLAAAGVDVSDVLVEPGRRTVAKRRISSGDHLHLRFDSGDDGPPAPGLADRLAAGKATAVLVGDYGTGLLTDAARERIAAAARAAGRTLVVDAHEPGRWAAYHPDVVTPNADEVATLLPPGLTLGPDRPATVGTHAAAILAASGAGAVIATLDADGAVLLRPDRPPLHVPAPTPAAPPERTAGAGDTFAAACTLVLAAGADLERAARVGCLAAAVVVARAGTSVCRAADLRRQLGEPAAGGDRADLADLVAGHRAAGRRIVFTNGCFDVLHSGHVAYLNAARALGDVLVVGVNSDPSVRRLKGPGRPINPLPDRVAVLEALSCVDHLAVFDGDTADELIALLRPEVYVKGGDYTETMLTEAPLVRSYGGQVRIVDYVDDRSTTTIVRRIRDSAP